MILPSAGPRFDQEQLVEPSLSPFGGRRHLSPVPVPVPRHFSNRVVLGLVTRKLSVAWDGPANARSFQNSASTNLTQTAHRWGGDMC